MDLLTLIEIFVVVGVFLYLINAYIPMEANVKKLMNIAVIVILCIWLLRATGLLAGLSTVRI